MDTGRTDSSLDLRYTGTNINADCLLQNTSTKHNKWCQSKPRGFDDISFRELFGRIKVFFYYKMKYVPSEDKVFIYILIPQRGNNMFAIFHSQ
jgi:hypothetical protein